ncbi:hypothetical protein AC579_1858 [Pseudocercospora musae]|uniref:Lipase B n=1 Tax=Pseudocercospora musae TaxID=113226 RepID=A0A139IBF2_9PEZI|nr:hypothetical protein AC579_1858 [Pseudocercospora musae]KXT12078.1 hypothetical protein AC579_1858 [Pseudocercospora musae]
MAIMKGAALACLAASALAVPTPTEQEAANNVVEARQATTSAPITNQSQLEAAFSSLPADAQSLSAGIEAGKAIFTNIVPAPGPTAIPQMQAELQKITQANPGDIFKSGAEILLNGLAGGDFVTIAEAYAVESSTVNFNPIPPKTNVYNIPGDAPYDLSEAQLRQVIYIPPDFTYGRIPPVVFLPGTGAVAGPNFGPNFGKLFKAQKVADPVYVNIPNENLGDIQVAAEYAAYAINYISSITSRKVQSVSWSAGSIDSQWALKYWPSTRKNLANKIAISPDYHGTIFAQLLCPGFETPGCTPAIAQQNYNSTFIRTLRNNGGDSSYVPTTNVYSIFDEIVQPQEDPNASGFLNAGAGGVSNTELQAVCSPFLPGGTFYNSHEGVLYNALAYALAKDAIVNGGPGQLSRVNASAECQKFAADGLSLADIFATEAIIPEAAFAIIAYEPKTATEPPIKAYAQKDTPA